MEYFHFQLGLPQLARILRAVEEYDLFVGGWFALRIGLIVGVDNSRVRRCGMQVDGNIERLRALHMIKRRADLRKDPSRIMSGLLRTNV